MFDVIAFDADDTLWYTETFYREVEQQYLDILARYGLDRAATLDEFHKIEIANLPDFGYGIKGFVISLIEAAVRVTAGSVSGEDVRRIIELGRSMVRHEIRLLPGVEVAVNGLSETHQLALITKGDLMDQERKIAVSGLAKHFSHIEIVSDKHPAAYSQVMQKLGVVPQRFLMVGNSMRSDILPVLELGGWAVHIPYDSTWAHEAAGEVTLGAERFFELPILSDLPGLLRRLEANADHP